MKKTFQQVKRMNPALRMMSEEQKNRTLIAAAYGANMLVTLMVLRDKFGFGAVRLKRFSNECRRLMDAYEHGYLNEQDIRGMLRDEVGIEVSAHD